MQIKTCLQKAWTVIKAWIKENQTILLYAAFAMVVEMIAVASIEGSPFMSRPFLAIGLLLIFIGIALLIKSERARVVYCACLLALQSVMDLVFSVIYDMTGQYFYYEMFNLRNDAVAALESIPVNFVTFYTGLFFTVIYIIYGLRVIYGKPILKISRKKAIGNICLSLAGVVMLCGSIAAYYPRNSEDRYQEMIEGQAGSVYASYGMVGNLFGELGSKLWERKQTANDVQMRDFLYANEEVSVPTDYYGVSKGKNVVMILGESFEWFSFLKSGGGVFDGKYPNALDFTDEELATLFPNLTKFYQESVVMSNYYSREKTDMSETLSIMGSYPLDAYISYDFYDNAMPMTLPNVLKITEEDMQMRSFHNGDKEFYNRIKTHLSFGFDEVMVDKFDMQEMSDAAVKAGGESTFINYDEYDELNLDGQMMETCKDVMFPKDKRFLTYITTITGHGVYYERENLTEHRARLQEVLGTRVPAETDKNATILMHYMTATMELDKAIGIMINDLEGKGILDNTLIVLFGDHNAYYQSLSEYVKGIELGEPTPELYRVPLMIYDQDLSKKLSGENRIIDKFACTVDIVPTVLDLLGVQYYENMYFGNSVFAKEQSALYSRSYAIFLSEGLIGHSVKKFSYLAPGLKTDGEEVKAFQESAIKLVQRMKYNDYIFIDDWFSSKANLDDFVSRMRVLNGVA